MKYILMMNTMRSGHGVPEWVKKDLQAHIAFMMGLNKELRESGELVSAEGLSFPDQAKLVRAGKDEDSYHRRCVSRESKEFLAGYWIVDVDSAERAYAIAAKASAAPGPGGAPLNMPIEVHHNPDQESHQQIEPQCAQCRSRLVFGHRGRRDRQEGHRHSYSLRRKRGCWAGLNPWMNDHDWQAV